MNAASSPGIGTAFLIMFNLLYFVMIVLLITLLIERIWVGWSRWIILPVVTISIAVFGFNPGLLLNIIEAVTGPFSLQGVLVITGFGILAGMAASSL